jgi:dTDP-4-dehydrorhamnose reductase
VRYFIAIERASEVGIKILLIGAAGQVGSELQQTLPALGELVTTDRSSLDLADDDAIRSTVRGARPDLIVNAAAYTQVDPAEADAELAMRVNGHAPEVLAQEAGRIGAALVHYSTDYVFSGSLRRPYREDDSPDPINTYGMTKLAGERAIAAAGAPHLILRTSWVYGPRGKNFFSTILKLAGEREELKVVDDQIGTPNSSRAVAVATTQILASMATHGGDNIARAIAETSGIYHVCAPDEISRFGFAEEILARYRERAAGDMPPLRVRRLTAVSSAEFPSPARRPHYSVLSAEKMTRIFAVTMPSWREQVALAFEEARIASAR